MKRFFFAVCAIVLFASINSCDAVLPVKGSKNIITKEISISDYDKISLPISGEIYYRQSDASPFLEITTDDNILDCLEITVKDRTLYIRPNKQKNNIRPTKFIVNTNSRNIKAVNLSGACVLNFASDINTDELEVHLSGSGEILLNENVITAKELNFRLSGSGEISLNKIKSNTLDVMLSGSSKVSAKGNVEYCNIVVSGSGTIHCPELSAENLDCRISGSGNIKIDVIKSLVCNISGSGSIVYTGNPTTETHVSGSGRVVKK
jgi:hypothetical protein